MRTPITVTTDIYKADGHPYTVGVELEAEALSTMNLRFTPDEARELANRLLALASDAAVLNISP